MAYQRFVARNPETTSSGQRGASSGHVNRSPKSGHSPPGPGDGFSTISDMLAALIDTNDTQVLSRLSKSEHSIKETILHVGTLSVVEPLVDFLVQLECAKLWIFPIGVLHHIISLIGLSDLPWHWNFV